MTITMRSRLTGVAAAVAVALVAAGCSTGESADPTTTVAETTTTTAVVTTTTTEPAVAEMQAIEVEQIGVASVVPAGWTETDQAGYTDDRAEIGFFAFQEWAAPNPEEAGVQPLGSEVIGGRTWELYAAEAGPVTIVVAATEIGQGIYGIQLTVPPDLVDQYVESAGEPALEAFEVLVPIESVLERAEVTIDGRDVAYAVGGAGPATVVFEAGLGSTMASWATVADAVAEAGSVFVYDRAGIGGSDASDQPRDGLHMVEELRAVLTATEQQAPYVLVGHSLGGTLMELYARTYPDEVSGMVLVDSRPAGFTDRCVAALGADECLPSEQQIDSMPESDRPEWRGLPQTEAQVQAAAPLGGVPVVVLGADQSENEPARAALWVEAQRDLAADLQATFVLAEDTGHVIQFERPELVLDAIQTILSQTDLEPETGSETP